MERTQAAKSRRARSGLDPFERFVETAHKVVSRGPAFAVLVLILLLWAASYPLWKSTTSWELALHTGSSILSVLLLVVLENAGRRSAEAAQEKLNVLAEALSALMSHHAADSAELREAVAKLHEAVGLEERH